MFMDLKGTFSLIEESKEEKTCILGAKLWVLNQLLILQIK